MREPKKSYRKEVWKRAIEISGGPLLIILGAFTFTGWLIMDDPNVPMEPALLVEKSLSAEVATTPAPVVMASPVSEVVPDPAPVIQVSPAPAVKPTPVVMIASVDRPCEVHSYIVVKDDTLGAIAESQYGDRRLWARLYAANKETVENPHLIYPDQVLAIPCAEDLPKSVPTNSTETIEVASQTTPAPIAPAEGSVPVAP